MDSRYRLLPGVIDQGDETGAQVVEYAMLGAVAAVACGTLVALVKGGLLERLTDAISNGLIQWVQTWFA